MILILVSFFLIFDGFLFIFGVFLIFGGLFLFFGPHYTYYACNMLINAILFGTFTQATNKQVLKCKGMNYKNNLICLYERLRLSFQMHFLEKYSGEMTEELRRENKPL